MNSSFEDTGPFSNQTTAQGSTCVQFHSEITLIQSYPLSPCVTTLWHWMIKYSWKNVQGVCFLSTLLCICKTCDQMFMPGSYWGSVCGWVLGVCLPCHALRCWKAKGYNFRSNKHGKGSGLKCELHSLPWMWFHCDLSYFNVSQLELGKQGEFDVLVLGSLNYTG